MHGSYFSLLEEIDEISSTTKSQSEVAHERTWLDGHMTQGTSKPQKVRDCSRPLDHFVLSASVINLYFCFSLALKHLSHHSTQLVKQHKSSWLSSIPYNGSTAVKQTILDNIKVTRGHVLTALVVTLADVVQALVTCVSYTHIFLSCIDCSHCKCYNYMHVCNAGLVCLHLPCVAHIQPGAWA